MLSNLTPFSFSFLVVYMSFMISMFSISDFFMFWLFIELCTLLFMGVSYTLFINSYSQLMFFFLVQTLASFNILVFYIFSFVNLVFLSLMLKTAMFPFMYWYVNVVYRFPNFILFFVSTVHKLPTILLFSRFVSIGSFLIVISIILTLLVGSILMYNSSEFRFLIIVSTTISTSWFILALVSAGFTLFLLFFIMYSLSLFFILSNTGPLSKFTLSLQSLTNSNNLLLFSHLINVSGFPPLPVFLLKLYILFNLCFESSFSLFYELLVILMLNVLVIVSYVNCFIKFFIYSYTAPSLFTL